MKHIKDIDKEYEDYCEDNNDFAPPNVKNSYRDMNMAFDEYLAAVSEHGWKCGYKYAMNQILNGGAQ